MSASKFLTLRQLGPYRTNQSFAQLMQVHNNRLAMNVQRTAYVRRGAGMMGDPSWLSQFLKHNKKIIGGVLGDVPVVGGVLSTAFNAIVPTNAPKGNVQTRPLASGPTGGGYPTGGLAPQPQFPLTIGNYPGGIASPIPDPTGGGGGLPPEQVPSGPGGTPPVVAIPSSGGGSMLYHHFFGTSKSRAIPISQQPMRPRGYHINRHGYYLHEIATWLEPGTVWVPNRRRNPLNPRALHRSIARLVSAKHAVRKLGLLDVPRRHHSARRRFPVIPRRKQLTAGR